MQQITKQKMTVCYIHGASHSGSTIFNMLLAYKLGALGLGESRAVLSGKQKTMEGSGEYCSCGSDMSSCPFWAGLIPKEAAVGEIKNFVEDYLKILNRAQKLGFNTVVDSSKHTDMLDVLVVLKEQGYIDLKVLFLIRDVRGWVASMKAIASRDNDIRFLITIRRILNWLSINRTILHDLEVRNLAYQKVSYEKLVFDTETTLNTVKDYVDITQVGTSQLHIAFGNRAKKIFLHEGYLTYDSHWCSDVALQFWTLFFLPVLLWNQKMVYNGK